MTDADSFEAFFLQADTDEDGFLSFEEVCKVLRSQHYSGSDEQIVEFFQAVDTSRDGLISYEEYMTAMGQVPKKIHSRAKVLRIFQEFDKDGNGVITAEELQEVLEELGRHLSEEEVKALIEMADKDGSGTLNYKEFAEGLFGM